MILFLYSLRSPFELLNKVSPSAVTLILNSHRYLNKGNTTYLVLFPRCPQSGLCCFQENLQRLSGIKLIQQEYTANYKG